jgi:hypothetical protein
MAKKAERLTAELKLRLPEPLRKKLELAAKMRFEGKGTSLNQEMIDRLGRSFGKGLLDELLILAYGPTSAQFLVEAHRGGIFKLSDKGKEDILKCVRTFLEHVQKGEAAI